MRCVTSFPRLDTANSTDVNLVLGVDGDGDVERWMARGCYHAKNTD